MALMGLCGLLLLGGLLAILRWGDRAVVPAANDDPDQVPSAGVTARRYLRQVAIAIGAGMGAGLLVAGAGGRLAMRLLAVTAGDAAQGRLTEADQLVGRISTSGTVDFLLFGAFFAGVPTGLAFVALRRWLPGGRLGGLVFGLLLLVVGASRVEPLRADNPDFGIVGPGPLALAVFAALVVVHGMAVAALAGRFSASLPLLPAPARRAAGYAVLLLLLAGAPVLVVLAVAGAVGVALGRSRALRRAVTSPRTALAVRVALAVAAVAAAPGFVAAAAEIART